MTPQPPKRALQFLRWFCREDYLEEFEGDLIELFEEDYNESPRRANWQFRLGVLRHFRPMFIRSFHLFNKAMIRHNFKISTRTLIRDKVYSVLNIGGLALGIAVALLIGLWILDEFSYDRHHENYEQIAQVMQNQTFNGVVETWGNQPRQIAPVLQDYYGSNFKHVILSSGGGAMLMSVGEKKIDVGGRFMQPAIADVLSLEMKAGNRDGLQDPSSIFLSESVAQSLFNRTDVVNETVQIGGAVDLKVSGVYKDLPFNSSFTELKYIAPWDFYVDRYNMEERAGWGNSWFRVYAQLNDNVTMEEASLAIKHAKLNHASQDQLDRFNPEAFLHPMKKWRLYDEFENGKNTGGAIQYIWMFGIIGIFVLLLACINFINLSTARSERRAREVGVRKALGSVRSQLMGQFFSESILVTLTAFLIAVLLCIFVLPYFNDLTNKEIVLPWNQVWFWALGLGFCGLIGLLSGLYPAVLLSSFQPVKVLKGSLNLGRRGTLPRRVLVVTQFAVSIALIIGSLTVFRQIQHVKNRPIGYNNERLLMVDIMTGEMNDNYEIFRNDLLNTGLIEAVAKTDSYITRTGVTNSGFEWEGKDPNMTEEFSTLRVTHDIEQVLNWEIIEGRNFSRDMVSDSSAFIINEAAAKYMGMDNPVGQQINWLYDEGSPYTIIGVAKNMITQNPFQPVKQMLFFLSYDRTFTANIKLKPTAKTSEAIQMIESIFKKHDQVNLFSYQFADEQYAKKFNYEERIGKLAGFFTLLAILISCLGVFGLAAYVAERRTKEIGIRKVLGASVFNIWQMLSKEFFILVLIASLVAVPLAWYYASGWLDNYVYRIQLSWWLFVVAALGTLLLTLLTVSFQAVKAAVANPTQALKSE